MTSLDLAQTFIQHTAISGLPLGLLDWVTNKSQQTQAALQSVLIVLGLLVAMIIAWSKRTFAGALGGAILGGFIACFPLLINFFSTQFKGETSGVALIRLASAAVRPFIEL